jgi:N-acetylglucosamine-6-phosphate deacetylase
MRIQNGKVLLEDFRFYKGTLVIREERILAVPGQGCPEEPGSGGREPSVDAEGCLILPGLVDIHLHGCKGLDLCDGKPEAVAGIAEQEALWGVTALCPATMTVPVEKLLEAAAAADRYEKEWRKLRSDRYARGSRILGLHIEGPFISGNRKGAQREEDILMPDIRLVRRLQRASGSRIRLLTFAPELPGAGELIRGLRNELVLSAGHTDADYRTAREAMENGVRHVTHLYNAMPPYDHREPGVVGAASDLPDVEVELIADGIHSHPSVIRNTFRMFGDRRVILVSDSMRAAGMQDGEYELGGQRVCVRGKRAVLENGTLAGSVTNLYDCLRFCVQEAGIPLETAVKSASLNPAASIGADKEIGSIAPGKCADLLIVEEKTLALKQVILRGRSLGRN